MTIDAPALRQRFAMVRIGGERRRKHKHRADDQRAVKPEPHCRSPEKNLR
jgi:hypothetical protein